MKLSYSNVRGKATNTSYPFVADIDSVDELKRIAVYDHVCAVYDNGQNQRGYFIKGYRSTKTFKFSDCLPFDCDNVSSDALAPDIDESKWKTPQDVASAFPNVRFYIVYSRNHMKEKDGKKARPKFHVYFPLLREIKNTREYNELKKTVRGAFPAFDDKALDAARFLYGVENPQAEYFDGMFTIDEFVNRKQTEISEGARNSTLSHFAGQVLKRFGDDDGKAHEAFLKKAEYCVPPLEDDELNTIWNSALSFYAEVKAQEDYISPSEYNSMEFQDYYIPTDFTDVGQATAFLKEYTGKVVFVKGLGFLYYDGKVWKEDETLVQKAGQDFTHKQLCLAWKMKNEAKSDELEEKAYAFYKFVLGRRKSSNIRATLNEIKPNVVTDINLLDADGLLLNTPKGTIDLRTGKMKKHDPMDYCTKITAVSPSNKGMAEFKEFLEKFTQGNKDLEKYLQLESGMEIIGGVYNENAVIETGPGGNGKSTYNNAKHHVLGDYAGTLSADVLTMNCKKNKSPEYAELRGKRFVIAAELQEGTRLDTAALKNLCSTDRVQAEKKFEAPFSFIPTHTTVLYTNHLPKVGTTDRGTWDRIVIIPLTASFRGSKNEIKNYGDVLFKRAGEAILQWMIEGAKEYIKNDFKVEMPECVKEAIAEYKSENDWLAHFIDECCEIDSRYTQKAGELYECYRTYCDKLGEYKRSSTDFKFALSLLGYETRKTKVGILWFGIRLKADDTDFF